MDIMSTPSSQTWTIGHDGSVGASHATEWAMTQAVGRGVHLDLVRSWQIPVLDFPLPVDSIDDFAPKQVCDDFDEIVDRASTSDISVSQRVVCGTSAQTLLDASAESSVMVLGSRGLGGFRRLLLGSVSSQCATHARVPTIVVPPAAVTDRTIRRIVVGFDGSERSRRALEWAIEFAPDGCEIKVVGAWTLSKSGYVTAIQIYAHEAEHTRTHFTEVLDELEAEAGSTLFERTFVYENPAATLVEESADADLLVVGQRGHSGLSGAILGSVSTHVLHHSSIPVAIVPDGDD